jgi:fucose permease
MKKRGVNFILLTFFGYCALESTAGLWASSYLVEFRGIGSETAATFASLFFLGITFGRFLCGFISEKIGDKLLTRYGIVIIICGVVFISLPGAGDATALAGLVITGLGCSPVYPSVIHSTPSNFGKENAKAIIGIQMASAYTGSTFIPPLFGLIADHVHIGLFPLFLIFFAMLMLLMSEKLNKIIAKKPGG